MVRVNETENEGRIVVRYQVRLLLNAAKIATIVAIRKADSRAQAQNDGRPLSMVATGGAMKFELNRKLCTNT